MSTPVVCHATPGFREELQQPMLIHRTNPEMARPKLGCVCVSPPRKTSLFRKSQRLPYCGKISHKFSNTQNHHSETHGADPPHRSGQPRYRRRWSWRPRRPPCQLAGATRRMRLLVVRLGCSHRQALRPRSRRQRSVPARDGRQLPVLVCPSRPPPSLPLLPPPPTAPAGRLPLSQPVLEWLEAANPLNLFPCLGPPQREFAGESLISREPAAEGSRRGVAPILSRQASSSVLPRSEGLTATSHCERGGCDAAAD